MLVKICSVARELAVGLGPLKVVSVDIERRRIGK